jgi:hypothetical protein
VNFGSFTFLGAVALCVWKNGKVPKFAVGRGGKNGLYSLETVMWNRLRVSGNVPALGDGGHLEALNCQPIRIYNRSTTLQ